MKKRAPGYCADDRADLNSSLFDPKSMFSPPSKSLLSWKQHFAAKKKEKVPGRRCPRGAGSMGGSPVAAETQRRASQRQLVAAQRHPGFELGLPNRLPLNPEAPLYCPVTRLWQSPPTPPAPSLPDPVPKPSALL